MPDEPEKPKRTTSFAKSLDDLKSDSPLLNDVFQRALTGPLPPLPSQQEPGPVRHAPAPAPQLRPPASIARPVDRQIDRERQAKEDRLAKEINDELSARLRGKGYGKGKDPERDM